MNAETVQRREKFFVHALRNLCEALRLCGEKNIEGLRALTSAQTNQSPAASPQALLCGQC